jgi:hypothetical protein
METNPDIADWHMLPPILVSREYSGRPVTRWPGFLTCKPANHIPVDPDMGDNILARLAYILGPIEIIATGPRDSPLPVTGHCSRCGTTTTRYGPAGSPLCDRCGSGEADPPNAK